MYVVLRYDMGMERKIEAVKKLLLHACCGPCSIEPLEALKAEGFDITLYWQNSNITPEAEHAKRFEVLRDFANTLDLHLLEGTYNPQKWDVLVAPHMFNRTKRCRACYAFRLQDACKVAKAQGFEYISTTLAVSPYQLFDTCNDVLVKLARAHGLTPVVRDFRPRYPEATKKSRDLGMYRQNYCGCRFSAAESYLDKKQFHPTNH